MNNTIRFVTGLQKRAKTRTLMESVGRMEIQELSQYHSLLLAWRIIKLRTPSHLADNITAEQDNNISKKLPSLMNTGFRWRVVPLWNSMNQEMKDEESYPRFKTKVKNWIMRKRPPSIQPDE